MNYELFKDIYAKLETVYGTTRLVNGTLLGVGGGILIFGIYMACTRKEGYIYEI